MQFDFAEIIVLITVIIYTLLSIFLIFNKKGSKTSDYLFTIFLFTQICYAVGDLMMHKGLYEPPFEKSLLSFLVSCELLYGASLYLYIKSILFSDYRLEKKELIHLLPFLFTILLIISDFFIGHFLYESYVFFRIDKFITRPLSLFYLFSGLYLLYIYKKDIQNSVSNCEPYKITWLYTILILFSISRIIHFYFGLAGFFHLPLFIPAYFCTGSIMVNSIIIISYALFKNEFFQVTKEIIATKYQKTKQADEQLDQYLEKISSFMAAEKPYLNPNLTIDELSGKIEIPPYIISQTINSRLNQNFFNFINSYRVEESKKMLISENDKTILEVLYNSGFNSKSTFNSIFKRFTGLTPSEFKNMSNN